MKQIINWFKSVPIKNWLVGYAILSALIVLLTVYIGVFIGFTGGKIVLIIFHIITGGASAVISNDYN